MEETLGQVVLAHGAFSSREPFASCFSSSVAEAEIYYTMCTIMYNTSFRLQFLKEQWGCEQLQHYFRNIVYGDEQNCVC